VDNKSVKIVIVEDDSTLGSALVQSFEREGLTARLYNRPEEALNALKTDKPEYIVTDCLLPQMTGIDFIMKTKQLHPDIRVKVILVSGIYTDKIFIQESIKKTQAIAFMKKPFDVEKLIEIIKKENVREVAPARKVLYQMFSKEKVTNREKRKLLESIEEVSGFDLPFIYSLLSETKSSGYLNIYAQNGVVSGVAFANGSIVSVDVEDKQTYLGELLIQSGYVTPEEVQKALLDKTNKRLGQRLIQNSIMSPHALDLMMTEQMNIRLSKTIVDSQVKLTFASSEVEETHPTIDSDLLLNYMHDWVASKIPVSWLKTLYTMWLGHTISATPSFSADHPILQTSIIKSLDGLYEKIISAKSLNQLLTMNEMNPTALYKALHLLLTKGLIIFSSKAHFASEAEHVSYLKKVSNDIKGKNPFEIMDYIGVGSMGSLTSAEILKEFLLLLGDKPSAGTEAFKIWNDLMKVFEDAVVKTSDGKNRKEYKIESEKSDAESKLKANQLFEEAKKDLQLNQYQKASEKMETAAKLTNQLFQLNIYMAWAKLGLAESRKDFKNLKDIELELMQVPPDERYDVLYPFVMGLYLKAKGDLIGAKKSFDKAIAIDPNFIVVRREIGLLDAQIRSSKKDIFNMDLKDVVSGFFKKK